jgi:hypothetical protein
MNTREALFSKGMRGKMHDRIYLQNFGNLPLEESISLHFTLFPFPAGTVGINIMHRQA